jgi:hypothetical protein
MNSKQLMNQVQIKFQKAPILLSFLSNLQCFQSIIESSRSFRSRVYTPMQTLVSFIKQVLHEDKSCSNAVSQIAAERCFQGMKAISVLTGAYVKARARLPEDLIPRLVKLVAEASSKTASSGWKFHNREVVLCDGTTVDMPDTKANRAVFPSHHNGKREIGFPLARILVLVSLTTGSIIDYAIDAFRGKGTGEVSLLRRILSSLKKHDILLADGLYCNFF